MDKQGRKAFRESVFERDGGLCVACGAPGQDAHHIMERRLFVDGGYLLNNGATVCGPCHLRAERTILACEELREACGITSVVLPDHLYPDSRYDKWGNVILPTGRRLPGELFDDESVQAVLRDGGVLDLFDGKVKYPRTMHLPWSESITADDRVLRDLGALRAAGDVIVTEKMDGQNVTMGRDWIYGRSTEWTGHPARSWVANLHGKIAHDIPPGFRVCGENLWAQHTLRYEDLRSYFLVFAIWDGLVCLPWDDTAEWAALLGLEVVSVLYRGPFRQEIIEKAFQEGSEGYVVRPFGSFRLAEFSRVVGKYVAPGFAERRPHWQLGRRVVQNQLDRGRG